MRFSFSFDPSPEPRPQPLPVGDGWLEKAAAPVTVSAAPPLPDDLDQRVRQTGEWQLEDW